MIENNQTELGRIAAIKELWRRGQLSYKLDSVQKELYKAFYEANYKISTWLLSRRQGKCLKVGTLIMTPTGPKAIENFKTGDMVYGYNKDGTLSLTPVIELIYSGSKQIRDIINSNKILASSTDEHKWLWEDYKGEIKQIKLGEVSSLNTHKMSRYFIDAPMGNINVSDAYALGALIGDGCSRDNLNGIQLYISSEDEIIPKAVASYLNCNYLKGNSNNYTWTLTNKTEINKQKGIFPVTCSYYDEWVRGRYAHEKILDINIIKTWNRKSQLNLLAGLLDTDGCVVYKENRLKLIWSMQSKSVIETIQYLLLSLFQYRASIRSDNRDKYKNGSVLEVAVTSNLFSKRALKELDPFLNLKRKKWNPEYEFLPERNNIEKSIGIKLGEYYEAECYDLALNNETHMYATVDGLITHNTYTLCILALEQCLRKPNSIVKFVSPTKLQVSQNVRPIMKQILDDCPNDIKPEFKTKDYIYYFPNGSELQMAGSDGGHAERLRGSDSDLFFVDEAGTCSDLNNLLKSILLPTTLITKGRGVLASTPPSLSEHDFLQYIEEAQDKGSLIKKTIDDNPRITLEQKEELIAELGGIDSEECRRELYCEIIKNARTSVIPEFSPKLEKEIVKEWLRPPFFHSYESMDVGGKDWTAVLYAYYDFRAGKIIIEDESIIDFQQADSNTKKLVEEINSKEKLHWTNPITKEYRKPYKRVSDIDYIFVCEILNQSKLLFPQEQWINFQMAKKDNLEAAINNVRVMIAAKKIIIHPRCKVLLRHLNNVKWNKNKDKFARSTDGSHYDTVAALIYLVRHIEYQKNPYPPGHDINLNGLVIRDHEAFAAKNNSQIDVYKKLFGFKVKRN